MRVIPCRKPLCYGGSGPGARGEAASKIDGSAPAEDERVAFDSAGGRWLSSPHFVPILRIVLFPDPILLRPTSPVAGFDGPLRELVADMVETMHAAPGVGLAANQVGIPLRVAVVDLSVGEKPEELRILVNPRILKERGRQVEEEGCLSVPGFTAPVPRPAWVLAEALDLEGRRREIEGEGLLARVLCHEIDHLEGRLYLHRLSTLKRDRLKREIEKARSAGEWDGA